MMTAVFCVFNIFDLAKPAFIGLLLVTFLFNVYKRYFIIINFYVTYIQPALNIQSGPEKLHKV